MRPTTSRLGATTDTSSRTAPSHRPTSVRAMMAGIPTATSLQTRSTATSRETASTRPRPAVTSNTSSNTTTAASTSSVSSTTTRPQLSSRIPISTTSTATKLSTTRSGLQGRLAVSTSGTSTSANPTRRVPATTTTTTTAAARIPESSTIHDESPKTAPTTTTTATTATTTTTAANTTTKSRLLPTIVATTAPITAPGTNSTSSRVRRPVISTTTGAKSMTLPPPVVIAPAELSEEAKALLLEIENLESEKIHEKYNLVENECAELYDVFIANLEKMSNETNLPFSYNQQTIDDYKSRLNNATETYQAALDDIKQQQILYKTHFENVLNEKKINHAKEIVQIKNQSENKINDLNGKIDELIQEGKQIAVDKLTLTKGIMTFKTLVFKRTNELEALTKNLTPQQKHEMLELRKQITLVLKKRDLFESSKQDQINKKRTFDQQTEQFIAAELYRRQLHNLLQEIRGSIRVLCRIRPLMQHDDESEYKTLRYEQEVSQLKLMLKEKEHTYSFDTILGPDSTQHDVFDEVNGVVQSAIDGYDVCLFSYGQTGSGKTHTMTGNVNSEEHKGIIPRSVDLIFDKTMELSSQGWNFDIAVSCCQIYQEKIFDLLNQNSDSNKNDLKIVNDQANKKIIVTDLQIKPVKTVIDVHQLLATAAGNRKVAQTSMNAQSSRSHFVFTLHVTMINTRTNEKRIGNLNLCDLAGSERVSSAKTTGEQFKETQKINLSLSTLNRVFLELAADKDHIPFRESKLTDLLQYCLSGNGKTMMIVNLSPTAASAQETSGSLQLARTVSMIQSGKHKGSVSKNGSTGVKGPVVRKAQVQIQQHHVSQQEHSDMVDHDTPCMSAQTIVNGGVGIKSGPDGNKRQRLLTVQSIKISTGDEDIDNELASLSEYAELPALFDPDHGMASLMPGKVIIDELTQLVGKVKMEYDSLMLFLGEMTTRLSTIQTLLPDINMDTVYNNVFNENQLTIDTAPMYIQQQIDIFVPKFDHFKEKLTTLKHSIQTSTLELSRKGQTLQFNSLKLELNSQEEKIEMLLLTLRAQSLSTNHSAEGIFNSYNILMTILSQFEQQEELFKQELDTMTNNLMSELDELSIEFNNALNCEYEDIMKQLQDNQTQFRNTYSTKYLAEIRALEKTGKLFEEVKSQHDELKQQYELLDGQVKGLDFLKEFNKNPTITPNDYIIDQRTFLQTKKDELVQLEQQCTSYDDELLNTRKTKLNKYRHHNQQLEVKIASLGGQNALMQLLTNPNGKEKKNNIHTQPQIVSNQDSILNNNNNNNTSMADDELTNKKTSLISQSIKPSSTTTTTTTTTAATAATHTKVSSQPIVSTKPKPLTATAPRTGNVATVPRSVPVSRSIPPTSSAVTKPLTTGTPNGSLSRVTTMAPRAGVKK